MNDKEKELLTEEALDWWRNAKIDKWSIMAEHPKLQNTGVDGIIKMYEIWHLKNPK